MPLQKHVQLIIVIIFNEYVAQMAIHAWADLCKFGYKPELKVQFFDHSFIFSATY
jgi:hypothetical protein